MDAMHAELWARIQEFQLDDPASSFPFSAKLAKENGWSRAFAARAIEEYRRFAFLGVAAGHPVSPSEVVDEVWHMHLTYTQSYWNHFCPEVLKKPFHHQPSTGGEEETEKFDDWYKRTLESYQAFFNEPPPEDIWPPPGSQFSQKPKHLDKSSHWIIKKPSFRRGLPKVVLLAVGLIAVGCTGASVGPNPLDWVGSDFLVFYIALSAVCIGLASLIRYNRCGPSVGDLATDLKLDPYSIAYLRNGDVVTLQVVIADLLNRGDLQANPMTRRLTSTRLPTPAHNRLQTAVMISAGIGGGASFGTLMTVLEPEFDQIEIELLRRGLLPSQAKSSLGGLVPVFVALIPAAFGIPKLIIGEMRNRPIAILGILVLVTFVVAVALYKNPPRSRYGNHLLKHLRERNSGIAHLHSWPIQPDLLCTSMAIFGVSAVRQTLIGPVLMSVLPARAQTSYGTCSSGCNSYSSGCGSSGCGSSGCGGGGCGGCGS
jgi:uncharacterized protein (TIGR04222 family)